MKSLANLEKTIPAFFKNFVGRTGNIEFIQVVERKDDFVTLSYDIFDETYTLSIIDKEWEFDESNAFGINETYCDGDQYNNGYESLEEYANDRFLDAIAMSH